MTDGTPPEQTATLTPESNQPEAHEASSFFAQEFERLNIQGGAQPVADELAPEKVVPDVKPADAPADAPAEFSAEKLLGLQAAEDAPDVTPTAAEAEESDEQIESDVPESVKTPKERNAWVNLRKKERDHRKRIATLETELSEARNAKPLEVDTTEVQTMRTEMDRYEQELAVTRVEATRQYREAVIVPMERVTKAAEAFAAKYEVPLKEFVAAINDDAGDALGDIAASFSERDRLRAYALAEESTRVTKARQIIVDNAKEAKSRIEAHEAAESAQVEVQRKGAYDASLKAYRARLDDYIPFLKKQDGATAWNEQIDGIERFVTDLDVTKVGVEAQAELAYRAALSTPLFSLLTALQNEHQVALTKLSKYQKALPGVGAGVRGSESSVADEGEDLGFAEIMRKKLT